MLKARSKLDLIDADVVSTVRFRQMARMVLVREGQLVEDMISNGLVKHQNAEEVGVSAVFGVTHIIQLGKLHVLGLYL